ncbi:hypothetical protein V8F20_004734 [Naviculisporaceae sp. PSN 640]
MVLSKNSIVRMAALASVAGNAILASAVPQQQTTKRAAPDDGPNWDILQTDTVDFNPDAIVTWYGNATQNALIAEAHAAGVSLDTLDFLQSDPSIATSSSLEKRQCPTSGITCKFDLQTYLPETWCTQLLTYLNDYGTTVLPYFPSAVCFGSSYFADQRCCASWPTPVLGYMSNIQLPVYLTYNHCKSGSHLAGVAKGVILGGICQNVCVANVDNPYWCSSG